MPFHTNHTNLNATSGGATNIPGTNQTLTPIGTTRWYHATMFAIVN